MSAAKHTPGPWEFVPAGKWYIGSPCGVQARTPEGPGFPTPSATGFYAMASPPPHGADKIAEQEANARLIALAPEMAAALQTLKSALSGWDGDEDDKDDCNWADITLTPSAMRKFRAILDKLEAK